MAAINVRTMPTSRLIELREQIDAILPKKLANERKELEDALRKLDSVSGLKKVRGGKGHALKGKKLAPKYRGTGGETWSGRGLKPRWLADALKSGKDQDDFLITNSSRKGGRPTKRK